MVHIRDYRNGTMGKFGAYDGYRFLEGKRRLPHDQRPCEIAANGKVAEVAEDCFLSRWMADLVLELSIAMVIAREEPGC